jgi:uncharacterized protein (TIGR02757 family)
MQKARLIRILEKAHHQFLKNNEIFYDALEPALRFQDSRDKEFAAFLCSVLAYGRISQVKKSIHSILDPMGDNPVEFLIQTHKKNLRSITHNWRHRFNTSNDMFVFLKTMQSIYSKHKTLENYIQPQKQPNTFELLKTIYQKFYKAIPSQLKYKKSFDFFVPNPELNSASKRMNLFLKWMVRSEFPDLGLWKSYEPSKLIVPLDTHIYKQAVSLGWTRRSTADLTTALEITEKLRELDPKDPTRFDFALCHLGIRGTILSS